MASQGVVIPLHKKTKYKYRDRYTQKLTKQKVYINVYLSLLFRSFKHECQIAFLEILQQRGQFDLYFEFVACGGC